MLAGDEPTLILLDELPPYFHDLDSRQAGNRTVADIATRAFAGLLTAAGKKKNVCVVVSDLAAAYDSGTRLINKALEDARAELGRSERNITPVDLATGEIFDILRKRLFTQVADAGVISDVAATYGRRLEEATKSKVASRGAEAIAEEIAASYPFHPRLKNLVALFKENENFKQTRGLIEFVSRLLKSVWSRPANDVYLIGAQHFDLSLPEVREKLTEISGMRDVIAKDLWDDRQSAHAQVLDLNSGKETATQVGTLLFTASLSTAVNAVKGLTREELVECLISPLREPTEWLAAFDALEQTAWYIHHTPEGRYYFDRQENLTKLLQNLAKDAPPLQVEELIRRHLSERFHPKRRTVYSEVLYQPPTSEALDKIRAGRVLLIINPDTKIPPDEVDKWFGASSYKNNFCVLTGDKTTLDLEKAARQLYAARKADGRIGKNHPQREELERKQNYYLNDLNATIDSLFDQVLFPNERRGRPAHLASKRLDMSRDTSQPFDGEAQIIKTLTADPIKLYEDWEAAFDAIREKAEDLL